MTTFLICIGLYIAHILICRQLWIWIVLIEKDDSATNKPAIVCSFIPGGLIVLIALFITILISKLKIEKFFTPKKYRK